MSFSGIYLAQDERVALLPSERIAPLVWVEPMNLGLRGDAVLISEPGSDFYQTIMVPDGDDAELLKVSESGDLVRYTTVAGEVVFRKPTVEDLTEVQLMFPEIEFPENPTEEQFAKFLDSTLFSLPA